MTYTPLTVEELQELANPGTDEFPWPKIERLARQLLATMQDKARLLDLLRLAYSWMPDGNNRVLLEAKDKVLQALSSNSRPETLPDSADNQKE